MWRGAAERPGGPSRWRTGAMQTSENPFEAKFVKRVAHASIAQTLDTYSHIIEGMDDGTTDAIEEVLD